MLDDRTRWNRKYLERGLENFGTSPTPWLIDHVALLPRRAQSRALDVACGVGHNARFLALRGFTVDAIDISDVAIDWLRGEVERSGLEIHPSCSDLAEASPARGTYDVILNLNFLNRQLFPRLVWALKPGGLLFVQTLLRRPSGMSGRSRRAAISLEPGELRRAFEELEILDYRETALDAEDPGKTRPTARLVARAPDHQP